MLFLKNNLKKIIVAFAKRIPLQWFTGKKLRVIMYHGIGKGSISVEEFEKQLIYLQKNFETFFCREIPDVLAGRIKIKNGKLPVVLTFDDGLHNNFTYVAPLLEKYQLKATFFIVSEVLQNERLLWNHEIFLRMKRLSGAQLHEHFNLEVVGDNKARAIKKYIETLKRKTSSQRKDVLEQLKQWGSLDLTESEEEQYRLMGLEDILKLPDNVELGSHTKTHDILDTLSKEDIEEEVKGARDDLNSFTGKNINVFCYPNGCFNADVIQSVREHYDIGLTVEKGFVYAGDDLHLLNRIPAGVNLNDMVMKLLRPRA